MARTAVELLKLCMRSVAKRMRINEQALVVEAATEKGGIFDVSLVDSSNDTVPLWNGTDGP